MGPARGHTDQFVNQLPARLGLEAEIGGQLGEVRSLAGLDDGRHDRRVAVIQLRSHDPTMP